MNAREYRMPGSMPTEDQRTIVVRSFAIIAVPVVGVLGYSFATGVEPLVLGLTAALAIVALGVGAMNGVRLQRKQWTSFRLLLGDDSITRRIDGFADVVIRRDEVASLREVPGSGLFVVAANGRRHVFVSERLDGFADVRAALSTWAPSTVVEPRRWTVWLGPALGLAVASLVFASLKASDARIVIPSGLLSIVGLGWILISIQRSADVARWAKVYMLMLVPTLATIAYRLWSFR